MACQEGMQYLKLRYSYWKNLWKNQTHIFSYFKNLGDFNRKIKSFRDILEGVLITTDAVSLDSSKPHQAKLKVFLKALGERENKFNFTENIVKMGDFVLINNYFGFNSEVKQQIIGMATGTKFALAYSCELLDQVVTDFLMA